MSYFQDDDDNDDVYSVSSDKSDDDNDEKDVDDIVEDDEIEDENAEDIEDEEEDLEMEGGGAEDYDEDDDESVIAGPLVSDKSKKTKIPQKVNYVKPDNASDEDSEEDEAGEEYLQKFDRSINENYLVNFHPESVLHNYDEIAAMIKVTRDNNGIIVDKLHRTIPFLTKYEKARIIGQRASQLNSGATPFIKVPENVIDGAIIAELELKEKKIPFIIRRPLPNGGSEYWSVKDLENIAF